MKYAYKAIFPRSRVVRRFIDHATYCAYLETVVSMGCVVSWPHSHVARVEVAA